MGLGFGFGFGFGFGCVPVTAEIAEHGTHALTLEPRRRSLRTSPPEPLGLRLGLAGYPWLGIARYPPCPLDVHVRRRAHPLHIGVLVRARARVQARVR